MNASRNPNDILRAASPVVVAAALLGVLALIAGSPRPAAAGDPLLVAWGNSNCSGDGLDAPDPVDSLFVLRADANLPTDTGDCPDMGEEIDVAFGSPHIWGDFDCQNGLIPVDSLKILRFDAALSVTQADGCPQMGEQVTIGSPFQLMSTAYAAGGDIPAVHTCDGANTSPPLSWTGVPAGTLSFFLAFLDADAGDFVHWLLYDIPAATTELAADADPPAGADEGMTSFGGTDYGGPCPPPADGPHEYVFTLYALDTVLNLGPGATAQEITDAIDGHVVGAATLEGLFDRQAFGQ